VGTWVQLLTNKSIDLDGRQRAYKPGDWLEVGRQTALLWVASGDARLIKPVSALMPQAAGVLLRRDVNGARATAESWGLPVETGEVRMDWPKTLVWEPSLPVRKALLPVGFGFLDKWHLAAPLWSYEELARDVGTPQDRARTEAVIRDLRVPLYDTRLLFLRRTRETRELLWHWKQEIADGSDERLAFLRALYRVKPVILALPTTWRN